MASSYGNGLLNGAKFNPAVRQFYFGAFSYFVGAMKKKANLVDNILQNRLFVHFSFWLLFFVCFTLLSVLNSGNLKEPILSYLAFLPSQVMAGYLLVYYQVPKLLLQKKYVRFGISFLLSVYVFSALARISSVYFAEPFFRKDFYQESITEILTDPVYLLVVYFPTVYVIVFLMLVMKVVKDRFEEKHQLEVLKKEQVNTELKFLKAQTNPHFLFNTLNNLYSLTLSKSDKAPNVVLKLSEILDYMLYQCNAPRVSLGKEIQLIQNYLDLESLRHKSHLNLTFEHNGKYEEVEIAPLILLTFVENAFKHGLGGKTVNPKIAVKLDVIDGELLFQVQNTKPEVVDVKKVKRGIGLENAKRQLELNYGGKYSISQKENENLYDLLLKLTLS
ncbi:MAG: histidine kinase [Bacteroidota bacterium]